MHRFSAVTRRSALCHAAFILCASATQHACINRDDLRANLHATAKVTPSHVPADGTTAAQIDIAVAAPYSGDLQIELSTSFQAAVFASTAQTDANGVAHFQARSTSPGVATFSVRIASATLATPVQPEVVFDAVVLPTPVPQAQVFLQLGALRPNPALGEALDVALTAVDGNNVIDAAYTGTVHFTSSDTAATLPADYTFTATDGGVHTFALGATFNTVGNQNLNVADVKSSATGILVSTSVQPYFVTGLVSGGENDSTCAVLNNKQMKCWGYNLTGSLGYGDTSDRGATPAQMGAGLPLVNMGAARSVQTAAANCTDNTGASTGQRCVLLDAGDIKCWGANAYGQLGYGDTVARTSPPSAIVPLGSGRTATALQVGCGFVCALLDNGQVSCWGYNAFGELGLGDTVNRSQPSASAVSLGVGRKASQIATGVDSTCALLDDKTMRCWGANSAGELGIGDTTVRKTSVGPVSVGTGRTAVTLASMSLAFCALRDDGSVLCWGDNSVGELGVGDTASRTTAAASAPVAGLGTVQAIYGGANTACALLQNGLPSCWGRNDSGQMVLGDTVPRYSPSFTANLGTGRKATTMAVANYLDCALLDDRTVKCWGHNTVGTLGLGDTVERGGDPNTMGDALPPLQLW